MAALINADGWLNLPSVRFSDERQAAGQHFYEFGLRLDEMFERLIKPLVYSRSIDLTTDHTEETATKFRKHRYRYSNVDIVLLEGIFLFKRAFADYFDLKIWLECSFETALERAVLRGQERLSPTETTTAYREIYFPAQEHHFKSDDPVRSADLVFVND
jgi:uridine kinase